jgi:TPR repeat protein
MPTRQFFNSNQDHLFSNVKSLFGGKNEETGPSEEEIEAIRTRANAGDADAQYNLGVMYDNGEGVPEDDVEAVAWFRQAAE